MLPQIYMFISFFSWYWDFFQKVVESITIRDLSKTLNELNRKNISNSWISIVIILYIEIISKQHEQN